MDELSLLLLLLEVGTEQVSFGSGIDSEKALGLCLCLLVLGE